jgi:hypothetical protein
MSLSRRWLREPLLHFVLAGALLAVVFAAFRGDRSPTDERTIVVDRRELLSFLQYRANAFEPETFGAAIDAMTDAEIDEVVNAYVDEEMLYREARAYGLEDSDNIIRQRMVQKMSFLLADATEASEQAVDPAELEAYFEKNRETYAIEPWVSFTHVFFDADERGAAGAREAAEAMRRQLNDTHAEFNDAPAYGDRFPYQVNYVERTLAYVASQFGAEFVTALETLDPSPTEWQGPLHSAFGEHVVLLVERVERSYPALDDVRAAVERDFVAERSAAALQQVLREIRASYRVRVEPIRSEPDE